MMILTVRQPWAHAIIHMGKDVDNRVRNIAGSYRGPVAIHAAQGVGTAREFMANTRAIAQVGSPVPLRLDYGKIIGVVTLVDVHSASVIGGCGRMQNDCAEHPNGCRHHCSPWAMGPAPHDGWYQHLVLADPRPLAEPIPYRGALGLRAVGAETIARIEAQL